MGVELIPEEIFRKFDVYEFRHAVTILKHDFPNEWTDVISMLSEFTIPPTWIKSAGGNKSMISKWVDKYLCQDRGWKEKKFETKVVVDNNERISPTHKVDCFKNEIALELEWNNKDPFYDRDLNNFRLLFDLHTVSVGIILTRSDELQEYFDSVDKGSSYGNSTTHMSKLIPRIEGGGGAGCPVLVFGIKKSCIEEAEQT